MNILPKQYSEFLDKQYWNNFFQELKQNKPDQQFFEWYGSYTDLRKTLDKLIASKQKVLNIGCGKSLLSQELNSTIGCEIVSCDYSEKIIHQMQQRPKTKTANLIYETADVFNLNYASSSFDVILDKGTLDAVFPEDIQQNRQRIQTKMLTKIIDILKKQKGSKYLIVSMLQKHVLLLIFDHFSKLENWNIDIYQQVIGDSNSLHPWLVSIQYAEKANKKLQLHLLNGQTIKGTKQQIEKEINTIQIQARFSERMTILRQDQKFSLNIYDKNREVRFGIQVIDSPIVKILNKNKCGVFIVPQGKQTTFLYGTQKGLSMVSEQIGMSRLILVKLISGNTYQTLDSIKKQLNSIIPKLLPKGCSSKDVPYMTDSDQLGEREYIFKDKDHIVQEVKIDDVMYRRLIINTNRGMVQSQYRLSYFNQKNPLKQHLKGQQIQKSLMARKKGTLIGLDLQQLQEGYERAVLGGLMLLDDQRVEGAKVLMLGGGGCVIPNFLSFSVKEVDITVVQIDKKIIQLAKKYFEVNESQNYKLVCADAIKFIADSAKDVKQKYDIIIFDINGVEGEPSPAPIFLAQNFLLGLKNLLSSHGMLIFHMINNTIPQIFKNLFNPIYIWNDGLVDVLFCFNQQLIKKEDPVSKKQIIVTKVSEPKHNNKRKKRWGWQTEAYQNIKLFWPKVGGIFDGVEVFVEQEDQLQNASQSQLKEDMQKVNKKKKKKK